MIIVPCWEYLRTARTNLLVTQSYIKPTWCRSEVAQAPHTKVKRCLRKVTLAKLVIAATIGGCFPAATVYLTIIRAANSAAARPPIK